MTFGQPPGNTAQLASVMSDIEISLGLVGALLEAPTTEDETMNTRPDEDDEDFSGFDNFMDDDGQDEFDDADDDDDDDDEPSTTGFNPSFDDAAFTSAMATSRPKPYKPGPRQAIAERPIPMRLSYQPDPDIPESSLETVASDTAASFLRGTYEASKRGEIGEYTFYLAPTYDHDEVTKYVKAMRQGVVRVRSAALAMGKTVPEFVVAQISVERTASDYWVVTMAKMTKEQHIEFMSHKKALERENIDSDLANFL